MFPNDPRPPIPTATIPFPPRPLRQSPGDIAMTAIEQVVGETMAQSGAADPPPWAETTVELALKDGAPT